MILLLCIMLLLSGTLHTYFDRTFAYVPFPNVRVRSKIGRRLFPSERSFLVRVRTVNVRARTFEKRSTNVRVPAGPSRNRTYANVLKTFVERSFFKTNVRERSKNELHPNVCKTFVFRMFAYVPKMDFIRTFVIRLFLECSRTFRK